MKCLLLLALCFVGIRAQLLEPNGALTHVCSGGPDPEDNTRTTITTFDGAVTKVTAAQKTMVARWADERPCNYNIKVVTAEAEDGQGLYYDWIACGFGIHPKNYYKFRTNVVFGQSTEEIIVRGHGFKGQNVTNIASSGAFWEQDGVVFVALSSGGVVKLRSSTCAFAINWYPGVTNKYDTRWEFWIGDRYTDVSQGLCQNADGDENNDNLLCPDSTGATPPAAGATEEEQWQELSDSCNKGENSYVKFQ